MFSEQGISGGKNIWEKVGWIGSFILFSTVLYFVLKFLKKIPESWNYFPILIISTLIIVVGFYLRKIIK